MERATYLTTLQSATLGVWQLCVTMWTLLRNLDEYNAIYTIYSQIEKEIMLIALLLGSVVF